MGLAREHVYREDDGQKPVTTMEMMLLVMVSSWGTAVVRVSTTPLRAPLIRSLKVERFRFSRWREEKRERATPGH